MKHLAAVGMSVLLAHRSARMPSGGVLSADRAAVPPIVGRWAVLRCVRRQAPRPFVDLMAPVQFAVPPATSRCAARSTGGRPCIAAAIMVGGVAAGVAAGAVVGAAAVGTAAAASSYYYPPPYYCSPGYNCPPPSYPPP